MMQTNIDRDGNGIAPSTLMRGAIVKFGKEYFRLLSLVEVRHCPAPVNISLIENHPEFIVALQEAEDERGPSPPLPELSEEEKLRVKLRHDRIIRLRDPNGLACPDPLCGGTD